MHDMCPAMRSRSACTYGEDYGPCDACAHEDAADQMLYGVPLPDYAEARAARMADEIRKLQAAVRGLSAAQRRSAK